MVTSNQFLRRRYKFGFPVLVLCGFLAFRANAQVNAPRLDTNCTVSILNRTAKVQGDGTYEIFNVPAGVSKARVRATCVDSTGTHYGESDFHDIQANEGTGIGGITFLAEPLVPTDIALRTEHAILASVGATSQLSVFASLPGGTAKDVTPSDSGTTYLSTNTAVATVSSDGLVTAVSSGRVLLTASHESIIKTLFITVSLGSDADGDGLPNEFEISQGLNPNNPLDAQDDLDNDGLSNIQEYLAGTALRNGDTDGDGIPDGEEVVAGADGFVTNPLLADTDGDGIRDGLEVQTATDPTNPTSSNLALALDSIRVAPTYLGFMVNSILPQEVNKSVQVIGMLKDGTTLDLTSTSRGTSYSSTDPAVAGFSVSDGTVFAGTSGSALLTITNNGFVARCVVTVEQFDPKALSFLPLPGFSNAVDIMGSFALVAGGGAGLHVAEVSDPVSPMLLSSFDTPGNANDVKVAGGFAYMADGAAGLQIIDVSNPLQPNLAGSLALPGIAVDLVVRNGFAYLANGPAVHIVDVSEPTLPTLLGTYLLETGSARGVDVDGNTMLVAADNAGLLVIDIRQPGAPTLVGSVANSGLTFAGDVIVRNHKAYVVNSSIFQNATGGFRVVDYSSPTSPIVIGTAGESFGITEIDYSGTIAFASCFGLQNNAFQFGLLNPDNPSILGPLDFSLPSSRLDHQTGVKAGEQYVYITGSEEQLEHADSGNTGLHIGQFIIPSGGPVSEPIAAIHYLTPQQPIFEDKPFNVFASIIGDPFISRLELYVNDSLYTTGTGPTQYFTISPLGAASDSVRLRAVFRDSAGNWFESPVLALRVLHRVNTTLAGRVLDNAGVPMSGTEISVEGRSALTAADGRFVVSGFSVYPLPFQAMISANVSNSILSGKSEIVGVVENGATELGDIVLSRGAYESEIGDPVAFPGTDQSAEVAFTQGFEFHFHGQSYSRIFINPNGVLSFTRALSKEELSGESDHVKNLRVYRTAFAGLPPAIAPMLLFSTYAGDSANDSANKVFVRQLPDRLLVTWYKLPSFIFDADPSTFQVALFENGNIEFRYLDMGTLFTDSPIVGVTPGAGIGSLEERLIIHDQPFAAPAPGGFFQSCERPYSRIDKFANSFVFMDTRPGGGYNVSHRHADSSYARFIVSGVAGRVLDSAGVPVPGVDVRMNGVVGKTIANGTFQLSAVPLTHDRRPVNVDHPVEGNPQAGLSDSVDFVDGGVAQAGDIRLLPAGRYPENLGNPIDFGGAQFLEMAFPAGFSFPFYEVSHATVFVNTNGVLTFGKPAQAPVARSPFSGGTRSEDTTTTIAPLWTNFPEPGVRSVHWRATPDTVFITWKNLGNFQDLPYASSDFQVALFRDGRIEFRYRSLPPAESVVNAGLWPGRSQFEGDAYFWQSDLSATRHGTVGRKVPVYETLGYDGFWYDTTDLADGMISFLPNEQGGYDYGFRSLDSVEVDITSPTSGSWLGGRDMAVTLEILSRSPLEAVSLRMNGTEHPHALNANNPVYDAGTGRWTSYVRTLAREIPPSGTLTMAARVRPYSGRWSKAADSIQFVLQPNQAPQVAWLRPATGAEVKVGEVLNLEAIASDDWGLGSVTFCRIVRYVDEENVVYADTFSIGTGRARLPTPEEAAGGSMVLSLDYRLPAEFSPGDTLNLIALASDLNGNRTSTGEIHLVFTPEVHTTLTAQVIDPSGNPVRHFRIRIPFLGIDEAVDGGAGGGLSTQVSAAAEIPLVRIIDAQGYAAWSLGPIVPVPGGVTDLGTIQLRKVQDPTLVAFWPFNGGAEDSSGNGHHGKVFGAKLTEDMFGRPNSAYAFTGDSLQQILCGPLVGVDTAFSYSAWFRADSMPISLGLNGLPEDTTIILGHFGAPINGIRMGLTRIGGYDPNHVLDTAFLPGFGTSGYYFQYVDDSWSQGPSPLRTGNWHHLVVTGKQGSFDRYLRLYIDGAFVEEFTYNFDYPGAAPFQIGGGSKLPGLGVKSFTGAIDDVKIFNRVLPPSAVQYLYEHPGEPFPAPIVRFTWPGVGSQLGFPMGMTIPLQYQADAGSVLTLYANGSEALKNEVFPNRLLYTLPTEVAPVHFQLRAESPLGGLAVSEIVSVYTLIDSVDTNLAARFQLPNPGTLLREGDQTHILPVFDLYAPLWAASLYANQSLLDVRTVSPFGVVYEMPLSTEPLSIHVDIFDILGNGFHMPDSVFGVSFAPRTLVHGQVLDSSGTPVAGAMVYALGQISAQTDSNGYYSIANVPVTRIVGGLRNLQVLAVSPDQSLFGLSAPVIPDSLGNTEAGSLRLTMPYSGVRAIWPFDGHARDISPNLQHGSIAGSYSGVPGREGEVRGGLHLPNAYNPANYFASDYVNARNPGGFGQSATYSVWIRLAAFPDFAPFVSQVMGTYGQDGGFSIMVGDYARRDTLKRTLQVADVNSFLNGTTPLDTGRWYHVAATADGESLKLYLDGELEATKEGSQILMEASELQFYFGRFSSPIWTGSFRGTLDEAVLYNRALSEEEIRQLYRSSSAP